MIGHTFIFRRAKSGTASKRGSRARSVTNLAIYLGCFIVLIVLVVTGYRTSSTDAQVDSGIKQPTVSSNADAALPVVTPAEAQSANLATSAALVANLSSADSVSSKSASLNVSVALNQPDATTVNKPQIADPTVLPQPIATYTARGDDTTATIAAKFGVSDQTIRWANNLTSDKVAADTTLTVPVLDGVVYTVKDGDNLTDVASKYKANLDEIISVNNLSDQAVSAGTKILLPDGELPANERPGYKPPVSNPSNNRPAADNTVLYAAAASGNRYSYGYCTWYAYNRRMAMGLPIGGNWGNAATWAAYARGAGYLVDHTPSVGAVMQTAGGWGGYGHVAVVEEVYPDGSIRISEMNYVGWNRTSTRIVTNPSAYNFIH